MTPVTLSTPALALTTFTAVGTASDAATSTSHVVDNAMASCEPVLCDDDEDVDDCYDKNNEIVITKRTRLALANLSRVQSYTRDFGLRWALKSDLCVR